jgi:hypothetical protein
MEDQTRQIRAYELMLRRMEVPFAERQQIMRGAELFFLRGWPNNHFTVGMATMAGTGLIPPVYDGIGSEGRYFRTMKNPTQLACPDPTRPTGPDVAPDCPTQNSPDCSRSNDLLHASEL